MKSCVIESLDNGEIDYDDLIHKIKTNKESHPIIFANIGTTMTGAIDDIEMIQERLAQIGIMRRDYYIHADAALSGMILPLLIILKRFPLLMVSTQSVCLVIK